MQVLESAKAHLEGGRADQVITELGPVLLSKASVQGRGAFTTKQCILEGLQLLQAKPFLRKHLSRRKKSPKAYPDSFRQRCQDVRVVSGRLHAEAALDFI